LEHGGPARALAFRPDGRELFALTDRKGVKSAVVQRWDSTTGKLLGTPWQHEGQTAVWALSPETLRLFHSSGGELAQLWDVTTGKPIGDPLKHPLDVASASFSPGGRFVISLSGDTQQGQKGTVWDSAKGAMVRSDWPVETKWRNLARLQPPPQAVV